MAKMQHRAFIIGLSNGMIYKLRSLICFKFLLLAYDDEIGTAVSLERKLLRAGQRHKAQGIRPNALCLSYYPEHKVVYIGAVIARRKAPWQSHNAPDSEIASRP